LRFLISLYLQGCYFFGLLCSTEQKII